MCIRDSPYATGNLHKVFLHVWRSAPDLQVNPGERAGCYAANAKLLLFLAFIFNVSFLTQTGQTAARLSGFHTPVETRNIPLLSACCIGIRYSRHILRFIITHYSTKWDPDFLICSPLLSLSLLHISHAYVTAVSWDVQVLRWICCPAHRGWYSYRIWLFPVSYTHLDVYKRQG